MNKDEQLSRLLRLKRHESPGQDYFAGFLHDFHAHQRLHPAPQGSFARTCDWLTRASQSLRRPALAWTALGAAATAALVLQLRPTANPSGLAAAPADPAPAASWQSRQTPLPAAQTLPGSSSPRLAPPAPGTRRTSDQPQDLRRVIGSPTPSASAMPADPAQPAPQPAAPR